MRREFFCRNIQYSAIEALTNLQTRGHFNLRGGFAWEPTSLML